MQDKNVKRYSLSRQVADRLEQKIEQGVYAVGDRIPTEPELTEMFGVSRNTLREAIQSLTAAGILEVKQGSGTYVRSNNRFLADMARKYDQVSLEDILEARNALEITISYLAARRRTESDLNEIQSALQARQELKESEKEHTLADIRFHVALSVACHNRILTDLYSSITSYLEGHISSREAQTTLTGGQIDALHRKLFLAIRDQDADEAQRCAQNILKI